jgi:hypothetical protein
MDRTHYEGPINLNAYAGIEALGNLGQSLGSGLIRATR